MACGVAVAVVTTSWDFHPRNSDLTRSLDPVSGWTEFEMIERFNRPDTWVLRGPADALAPLTVPGTGVIVDADGDYRTSGQVGAPRRYVPQGGRREQVEVSFSSDLAELGTRSVLPSPSTVIGTTPTPVGAMHDRRVGTREDQIIGYIRDHLGSGAQVNRRLAGLSLPVSQGRGGTTTTEARFDNLGALVQSLGEAGRLRVTLEHDESLGIGQPRLALRIQDVPDVSANIRFGPKGSTATGRIASYSVDWEKPSCTAAIVVAGEEGADRLAIMHVNGVTETLWGGRRWEKIIDQRQTVDPVVMATAAQKELDEGAGFVNIALEVVDGPDLVLGRDFWLGHRIGVDLPGLPDALSDDVVREVKTVVRKGSGGFTQRVSIVVGSPEASYAQTRTARQTAKMMQRIAAVERSR